MLDIGHAVVAHELADLAVIQPDAVRCVGIAIAGSLQHLECSVKTTNLRANETRISIALITLGLTVVPPTHALTSVAIASCYDGEEIDPVAIAIP